MELSTAGEGWGSNLNRTAKVSNSVSSRAVVIVWRAGSTCVEKIDFSLRGKEKRIA